GGGAGAGRWGGLLGGGGGLLLRGGELGGIARDGERQALPLPHALQPRGGVGTAERDLAQPWVVERGDVAAPDVEVHEGEARVPDGGRPVGGARIVALLVVRQRVGLVLAEDAVDVVAPGADRDHVVLEHHGEAALAFRSAARSDEVTCLYAYA